MRRRGSEVSLKYRSQRKRDLDSPHSPTLLMTTLVVHETEPRVDGVDAILTQSRRHFDAGVDAMSTPSRRQVDAGRR